MQTVQKLTALLCAIAFCSLFLLGCSSEEEATVQEAPAETVIEQVEPEITLPLDQQPGEEDEVHTTPEEEMETGEEQEETVSDETVEAAETDS
ncbi:hypothetical protein [Desulfobulbus alkaliphilus]|uniref:hypothetical protein n=1 Tax=Desulfobulbus alkaliphilus TaxID=869814 RepID=UPI0019650877|nr:hypothetical protein [Desulfobulbus alkaliphilus]MBM9536430.1 hypothetical protein [Desulfobulbus alkaliphilus]